MQSRLAENCINHIKSEHPDISQTIEEKLLEAYNLINEKNLLRHFTQENLESLYKIEMINPSYFPGLSIEAANTFLALNKANSELSFSLLFDTIHKMAERKRPWESLRAFSDIANACPKQMNESMLNYLLKIPPDTLEISNRTIRKKTAETKAQNAGIIGALSPFLNPSTEIDIHSAVQTTLESARSYGCR